MVGADLPMSTVSRALVFAAVSWSPSWMLVCFPWSCVGPPGRQIALGSGPRLHLGGDPELSLCIRGSISVRSGVALTDGASGHSCSAAAMNIHSFSN